MYLWGRAAAPAFLGPAARLFIYARERIITLDLRDLMHVARLFWFLFHDPDQGQHLNLKQNGPLAGPSLQVTDVALWAAVSLV